MKRIRVTYETARDALLAAEKQRGAEFLYGSMFDETEWGCRYLAPPRNSDPDDSPIPACLVGVALTGLDEAFEPWLWNQNSQAIDAIAAPDTAVIVNDREYTVRWGDDEFTFEGAAVALLAVAQQKQDSGLSWGLAIADALETVKR